MKKSNKTKVKHMNHQMNSNQLKIIGVAIVDKGGAIISLPKPYHHSDVIMYMVDVLMYNYPVRGEHGYILSDGTYRNRKEAMIIAREANQIMGEVKTDELYSEHIW